MTRRHNSSRRFGSRRGNAMLEMALGVGVIVATFAGTFRFGYTFYQYNLLKNATSAGARYASLRPYDSTTTTPSSAFATAVKNVVVYGDPTGGTSPVAPGLQTSHVVLTPVFANGVPVAMTVALTGYTISAVFGNSTLTNKPTVTFPYTGIWSPY